MAKSTTTTIGGTTTSQSGPAVQSAGRENRHQAPIKWPKPDGVGIGLFLLWVVGVIVALGLPGLIVNPNAETAPRNDILLAGGLTVVGCLVMIAASYIAYRRSGEIALVMLGGVPAFSCLAGGVILAATKLTATGTGVG